MQFPVDCCEQQSPVFKTNEFNWHLAGSEVNTYWCSKRQIVNNDGKAMFLEFRLDTISFEFRLEFHRTGVRNGVHSKCCKGVTRTCVRPRNNEDILGSAWDPSIFAVGREDHGQTGCIGLTKVVNSQPKGEGCVGRWNIWNSGHRAR